MEFSIKEYNEYNEAEILNLYKSVGWINYVNNPVMLQNAYANSLKTLGAYHNEQLIGIIRVVGDGYSILYIQDILVLPAYQHLGIGTALVNQILKMYKNVYQKTLLTDDTEKTVQFYKSIGFQADHDMGCKAFIKMD